MSALLDWGVASLTKAGEAECGDLYIVEPLKNGTLVAVMDGLGHGPDAAAAARAAAEVLKRQPQDPVISLIQSCHSALRGTRGVVMSMASFDARRNTMTFIGVGNVEGMLLRSEPGTKPARESLLLRRGVVGGRLPQLTAMIVPVVEGDTLVLMTDGIRHGFEAGTNLCARPQETAERILDHHGTRTDDALVLVARYNGHR